MPLERTWKKPVWIAEPGANTISLIELKINAKGKFSHPLQILQC